jgi:predicted transcriptional regulator
VDYPVNSSDEIIDRFKHITIKGIEAQEIIKNIKYPIKNPAELLKEIKDYLAGKEVK